MDENTILLNKSQKKYKSSNTDKMINIYESMDNTKDINIILNKKKTKLINIYKFYNKRKLQYIFVYYGIGLITSILSLMITTLTALNKFDDKYEDNYDTETIDYLLFLISGLISGFTLILNFFKIETQINKLTNICTTYKTLILETNEYIIKNNKKKLDDDELYDFSNLTINKLKLIHNENLYFCCDLCSKNSIYNDFFNVDI